MARIFALLFFSVYLVCESRSFSWYSPHWIIAVPEVQAASDKRSLISVNVDEIAQRVGLVNLGNVRLKHFFNSTIQISFILLNVTELISNKKYI